MTLPLLLLACADKAGPSPGDSGEPCAPSAWYADQDGDGFGAGEVVEACAAPTDHVEVGGDCDDSRAEVHPGGTESCNGLDDDCDGLTDPPTAVDVPTCTWDGDGDGWGNALMSYTACTCNDGYTTQSGDCDDTDTDRYPGAAEVWYDGVDQDCAEDDDDDQDGDGWTWDGVGGQDCDDTDPTVHPDAEDLCGSSIDEDCDGARPDCGLFGELAEGDAWLTVATDPEVDQHSAFSQTVAHADDNDGDGVPELVEAFFEHDGVNNLAYLVMEPTVAGTLHPTDLIIGSMRPTTTPAVHRTLDWQNEPRFVTDIDLDGDGYRDFIVGTDHAPSSSEPGGEDLSRLDIWAGPIVGEHTSDDAVSIIGLEGLDTWMHGITTLADSSASTGWQIVVTPEHHETFAPGRIEGWVLGQESFDSGLAEAPRLFAPDDKRPGGDVLTEDLDGDGFRDIVMSAQGPDGGMEEYPGNVWLLRGPVDADISLADADASIVGSTPGDYFGSAPTAVHLAHGGLALALPTRYLDDEPHVRFFDMSSDGQFAAGDFVSAIVTGGTDALGVGQFAISDIGDIDHDGTNEIAMQLLAERAEGDTNAVLLYEAPASGTLSADAWQAWITLPIGDSGSHILSGVDYDGDSYADLVIGQPQWADGRYDSFGRFQIFRGGPDGF